MPNVVQEIYILINRSLTCICSWGKYLNCECCWWRERSWWWQRPKRRWPPTSRPTSSLWTFSTWLKTRGKLRCICPSSSPVVTDAKNWRKYIKLIGCIYIQAHAWEQKAVKIMATAVLIYLLKVNSASLLGFYLFSFKCGLKFNSF